MVRNAYPGKKSAEWEALIEADMIEIGQRVRAARQEANLSQSRLAGLMDVALNTLRAIEHGSSVPNVATLKLLAMHLEVDPRDLLGGPVPVDDEPR